MNWKTVILLLTLLVCHVLFSNSALSSGTVRVAVHETKPLAFTDEDGELKGIFPELVREIARLADWNLEIIVVPWPEGLKMAETGQVDLLGPIGLTQERLSMFAFNQETVIVDWGQIYSQTDLQLKSIFDLEGKTIAIQEGHIMMPALKDLLARFDISCKIIPAKDQNTVFQMVASKEVDACAVNRLFGLLNEINFKVERSPIVYHPLELRFAGPKQGREKVFADLDHHLRTLKQDKHSAYHQILDRWLLGEIQGGWHPSLQQMLIAAVGVSSVLILFFLWARLLKIQVRKRTHELLESESRFRQLVENINEVFWIVSIDWEKVDYISPSYETVWGRSCESLYSNPVSWLEAIVAEDRQSVIQYIEEKKKGDLTQIVFPEYRILRPDGAVKWILARGYLIRDPNGNHAKIAGIAEDITESKLYEERLRESETQFRSLIESTSAVAWQFDLEKNRWTYVAPQAESLFGFASHEWTDFDFWKNRLHPQDREDISQACMMLTAQGKDHILEYRFISKSGETIWIRDIVEVQARDGRPFLLRGFMFDISDRKKSEEERERLQTLLTQAQKMESIGTLSGGIAHDFNNILFPIVGNAELLLEDLPEGSLQHEKVKAIFNAGRRGAELVKQILAFSRKNEHKLIPVHIQTVLNEVLKFVRPTIPSNIEIISEIKQECGMVMADPTQIHQVAMNIITNAYHAVSSKPENGRISIQLKEFLANGCERSARALDPGRYVQLSITDNGQGIPDELQGKIFEPYFTTKEVGKGTGLGLSVVYGIIKEHKGEIAVESEMGKGTTFNVFLPVIEKEFIEFSVDHIAQLKTGEEHILLVDDEEPVASLESMMLSRLGYKVTFFISPHEALKAFKTNLNNFDLVITDMTMPGMTGDRFAKEILSIKPFTPIIVCTGFSERMNETQAEKIGLKGILMKPVKKSDLAEMVRKVLDESKNLDEI